jgi:tetratricopeptide (TPR) repeat protein
MRVGLNSGPVVVGSIGDDLRMDYTAVGDTTNMASRMENMAGPGRIALSNHTHRLVRDFFEFNNLGNIEVKGKKEPQEAFELLGTGDVDTRIAASVAKGLTQFVGRENSILALMEAYNKTRSGSGQVVGLVGDAGVGKSRLLLEFRNRLPRGEFAYFEGQCLTFGGAMAYLPILEILRSYFKIKEGELESIVKKNLEAKILQLENKLQDVLPPFYDLLSLDPEDAVYQKLEPREKRERTFEAIRDLLIYESQKHPLVIVVDDLHWIDKTSEEFLDYLIGWLANARILLILLYRPEYSHLWGSKSYYTKIGVDQLSTPTSVEFVRSIFAGGDVVPELRELILKKTVGNPLFMEEFSHSLLENGTIQMKNDQYVLNCMESEIDVPDTIQGIISARIDRLEENVKSTMQTASVIGRDFAFRILQSITGKEEELKSHLANLQGLEFIYEKRLFPELEYIFKHILTQEVAYNSLLTTKRKEIHQRTGKAIETIYKERLEEFYEMLAYHYSKSENLKKASHYLKMSGIKAVGMHSAIEAFNYYGQALKALQQLPESLENKKAKIEVCLLSLVPSHYLGYPEDSLRMFQEAERCAKEIEDDISLAHSKSMICVYYFINGESLKAIKYGKEGFEIANKAQDVSVIAPLAMDLCYAYSGAGLFHKVLTIAPDVLHLLEEKEKCSESFFRAIVIYPSLCVLYGWALGALGNFAKGTLFCKKGLQISLEIGDLRNLAANEVFTCMFYGIKGDGKLLVEHAQNCIKYSEEAKWYPVIGGALAALGCGLYLLGDPENARGHLEKGIKIARDNNIPYRFSMSICWLSALLLALGEYKIALSAIDEALKIALKYNEKDSEGFARIWLGRILVKTDPDQFDRAKKSILEGIKIVEELKLKPYSALGYMFIGELYTGIDRKETAQEKLKKAERLFQEMGMDYWLAKTKEVLARL